MITRFFEIRHVGIGQHVVTRTDEEDGEVDVKVITGPLGYDTAKKVRTLLHQAYQQGRKDERTRIGNRLLGARG